MAIENAEEPVRYQRSLLDKRKLARQEEKEREEEEDIRKASHADSLDQTKIQLEQEKQVPNACRLKIFFIKLHLILDFLDAFSWIEIRFGMVSVSYWSPVVVIPHFHNSSLFVSWFESLRIIIFVRCVSVLFDRNFLLS